MLKYINPDEGIKTNEEAAKAERDEEIAFTAAFSHYVHAAILATK